MTLALAMFVGRGIGFFGQTGAIWALLGFICFCIVVAILFKRWALRSRGLASFSGSWCYSCFLHS